MVLVRWYVLMVCVVYHGVVQEAIVIIYEAIVHLSKVTLILYSHIQHAMLRQVSLWVAQHTATSMSRSNFRAHIQYLPQMLMLIDCLAANCVWAEHFGLAENTNFNPCGWLKACFIIPDHET